MDKRTKKAVRRPRISVRDVMELLGKEYGPFEWAPRYDTVSELVYTILSQHTSDSNSKRAFDNLMQRFQSFSAIERSDVSEIEKAIRVGGLSRTKAPRIKAVLNQIHDEVGSYDLSFLREMPLGEAKAWLKRLNGIGPKTAAIILCFSLGMPAMPVDTHIYRVAQRLRLIGPKVSPERAHDILEKKVPPQDVFAFHLNLIHHGRQVCKARSPRCESCVLAWGCSSRARFQQASEKRGDPKAL